MKRLCRCILLTSVLAMPHGCRPPHPLRPVLTARFQLSSTETSRSAQSEYETNLKSIQNLRREVPEKDCVFEESKTFRCLDTQSGPRFLPPFPVVLPHKMPSAVFSWAPLKDTFGGGTATAEWKSIADVGEPFDCEDEKCRAIVRVFSRNRGGREDALASCELAFVGEILGPPRDCEVVAIIGRMDTWVKVVAGYSGAFTSDAVSATSSAVVVSAQPSGMIVPGPPALNLSAVIAQAEKALRSAPLALRTHVLPNSVVGAAQPRRSSVLRGWFEWVDVRVDVQDAVREQKPAFELTATVHMYVNKQNTPSPKDWRMPDEQLYLAYREAVHANLRAALGSLCRNPLWRDSYTMECDEGAR